MSLSNALSNAVSGIVAASRGTEVVSTNLANALTPGFARRELQLSPRPYVSAGGGVHVDGVSRIVRTSVLAQNRIAAGETARTTTLAEFHKSVSDSMGVPGESRAMTTLVANFDAALVTAAARPDNETNLGRVVATASQLAQKFNTLGAEIQNARTQADRAISADVQILNDGLKRIAELNRKITVQLSAGNDATALQDARQATIDEIARIVPLQEVPREGGRIALFTMQGGVLLDGSKPLQFDFQPAGPIIAGMQVGTSQLRLLSVEGIELTGGGMSMFAGGRLGANFQIRDIDAPAAQARLDSAAHDIYSRFAASDVDLTLSTGAAGLFTDAGSPLSAAGEVGLSQRLQVNAAADPDRGGQLWRVRDGLEAAAPGAVGESALLDRMRTAMARQRIPDVNGMSLIARTAGMMASDITSAAAAGRLDAEGLQSAASAQSNAFEAMMRQDGVDSDKEMETLLALERAYASNAKVLKAVDEMIQTILRLT